MSPVTEVRFASFLSGGFITMAAINPPDWKLANRTVTAKLKLERCHFTFFLKKKNATKGSPILIKTCQFEGPHVDS